MAVHGSLYPFLKIRAKMAVHGSLFQNSDQNSESEVSLWLALFSQKNHYRFATDIYLLQTATDKISVANL